MRVLFVAMHYGAQGMPARPTCLLQRAIMQRISEVLQLSIIIEGRGPLALEPQELEKIEFTLRRIAAKGRIHDERLQPRLLVAWVIGGPFKKLKFLQVLGD